MLKARVEIDGLTIAYRQWGTAETPPLVLAHGLPDGGFTWTKVAEALQDEHRILAFDLPAFGDSPAPAGYPHTVAAYGKVLDGFLEALRIERFALGVHDISGAYAVPVAARHREGLVGLLLMNTQVFAGWHWHPVARAFRRPVLGRMLTLPSPRRLFEKRLGVVFADDPPPWYLDELWSVWRRGSTRRAVMNFYRNNEPEAWAPAEAALSILKGVPAAAVWGQTDPFIRAEIPTRIGEALDATVTLLPEAGHFPAVERPDAVAEAARRILAG